jgi:hypothetical protein
VKDVFIYLMSFGRICCWCIHLALVKKKNYLNIKATSARRKRKTKFVVFTLPKMTMRVNGRAGAGLQHYGCDSGGGI